LCGANWHLAASSEIRRYVLPRRLYFFAASTFYLRLGNLSGFGEKTVSFAFYCSSTISPQLFNMVDRLLRLFSISNVSLVQLEMDSSGIWALKGKSSLTIPPPEGRPQSSLICKQIK